MEDRFWEKVQRGSPDECWIWLGAKTHNGNGRIHCSGTNSGTMLAHRYSYLINVGLIPEGIYVCHHCDNPPCVNPTHLFLGTHTDNMRDAIGKGRFVDPINGIINRAKTHCRNGHEYNLKNTYIWKNMRHCRTCGRDRMRKRDGYGLRPMARDINRNKTHCAKGHEFTQENTYLRENGWRNCRQCRLDYYHRKRNSA